MASSADIDYRDGPGPLETHGRVIAPALSKPCWKRDPQPLRIVPAVRCRPRTQGMMHNNLPCSK